MSKIRKVQTYKYALDGKSHNPVKVEDGIGEFIQYGVEYEEFESGPGNYSTAIIEMTDGTVKNIPLHLIRFIYPQNEVEG